MRKIKLTKYKDNTVYSIYTEKYGKEYHLGFIQADKIDALLHDLELEKQYDNIKKPCPEAELMANAVTNMIKIDKKYNITKGNRDGLD